MKFRDFVNEGEIDVALRVLDDLGGLRRLYVLGEENLSAIHTSIYFGQLFRYRRCLTRNDFDDLIDGMNGIPGIDSLRRIPEKKVLAAPKAGNLLNRSPANVFRDARIDRLSPSIEPSHDAGTFSEVLFAPLTGYHFDPSSARPDGVGIAQVLHVTGKSDLRLGEASPEISVVLSISG